MPPSLIRKISRVLAAPQQRQRPKNGGGNRRRQPKRSRRRNFGYRPRNMSFVRSLPAAFVKTPIAKFSTRPIDNGILVNGCDLVYQIPSSIQKLTNPVFAVIPSNPLFWKGTRICSIANMYQNYRPLSFRIHYIPQVAVTQPGTVVMGTVWETTASSGDIQQTLLTSNGGLSTPCYSPASTNVRLSTNLSMNLYRVHETGTYDSVPFNFLAVMAGGDVVPGYFFVSYSYLFKNAMGGSWTASTYSTTIKELPVANQENIHDVKYNLGQNNSIVTMAPCRDAKGNTYGAGKTFAVESTNKVRNVITSVSDAISTAAGAAEIAYVIKDNGSDVLLPAELPVKTFSTTSNEETTPLPVTTLTLALADKVPSTTEPTSIPQSEWSTYVQWDTESSIHPVIKTSPSTVFKGIPYVPESSTGFADVTFHISISNVVVSVLVPVKAGGSAKLYDSTFLTAFKQDTLVHFVGWRPDPEGDKSLFVVRLPPGQTFMPVIGISHIWQGSTLPNCWLAASALGPADLSFSNIPATGTYSNLDAIPLASMNNDHLFAPKDPTPIVDFKTSAPVGWFFHTVTEE